VTNRAVILIGAIAISSVALASNSVASAAPSTQPRDASIDRLRQRLEAWRSRLQHLPPRPHVFRFGVPSRPPISPIPALPRRPGALDRQFGRDPMPNWSPPAGSVPWDFNGVRYWVVPLGQPRWRS
jgi:hypothetical protein